MSNKSSRKQPFVFSPGLVLYLSGGENCVQDHRGSRQQGNLDQGHSDQLKLDANPTKQSSKVSGIQKTYQGRQKCQCHQEKSLHVSSDTPSVRKPDVRNA